MPFLTEGHLAPWDIYFNRTTFQQGQIPSQRLTTPFKSSVNENLCSWALWGPLKLNEILILSFTKISLSTCYVFETFLMSSNETIPVSYKVHSLFM